MFGTSVNVLAILLLIFEIQFQSGTAISRGNSHHHGPIRTRPGSTNKHSLGLEHFRVHCDPLSAATQAVINVRRSRFKYGNTLLFNIACQSIPSVHAAIHESTDANPEIWQVCRWTEPIKINSDIDYVKKDVQGWRCFFEPCQKEEENYVLQNRFYFKYSCGKTAGRLQHEFLVGVSRISAIEETYSFNCCTIPFHSTFLCQKRLYHTPFFADTINLHLTGFYIASIEKEKDAIIVKYCKVRRDFEFIAPTTVDPKLFDYGDD